MSGSLVDRVWADVGDRVGDDLRVVTRFDGSDFETRMREDIREQYTESEDRRVVDDTILKHLSLSDTESRFKTGEVHGLVRVFEEAWILSWGDETGAKAGLIVSMDRDGDEATMDDVDWCVDYLNEEVQRV